MVSWSAIIILFICLGLIGTVLYIFRDDLFSKKDTVPTPTPTASTPSVIPDLVVQYYNIKDYAMLPNNGIMPITDLSGIVFNTSTDIGQIPKNGSIIMTWPNPNMTITKFNYTSFVAPFEAFTFGYTFNGQWEGSIPNTSVDITVTFLQ